MDKMKIHLIQIKINELLAVCDEHNNDPGELINILHAAQGIFGYLPREVQEIIAGRLHIPVSRVYGVVTFYSFFTMTPKGKYPISVCLGTACYVRGAEKVLDEFQRQLEIKVGETTPDGLFSLDCLRCVGACGLAPVVTIVCNFTQPAEGQPALLSADEAETLFHEFGHGLHNLFKDVHYYGVSGVPRDFVELPSQIMEHWVFEPEVLKVYALPDGRSHSGCPDRETG
mgnify:CR=1 FL=1